MAHITNSAPLASSVLPLTDARGGVYRTARELRDLADRLDQEQRRRGQERAPHDDTRGNRGPRDAGDLAVPLLRPEEGEDSDDDGHGRAPPQTPPQEQPKQPGKLEQGADWFDRGTAAISRRIERCTGKDASAINVSSILMTSYVKLVLITSQLIGETSRLAALDGPRIGANCPNVVSFFARLKDVNTPLSFGLIAANLAAFAALAPIAQRAAQRRTQRRWRWLHRGLQWLYRLSCLVCLAVSAVVSYFNFSNVAGVYRNSTGLEYLLLPVTSLWSSVLKLLFHPSFYVAAGSAAGETIEDKVVPLTDAVANTLRGHSSYVYALAVLPGGTLASGSADNSIKLWDGTAM